MPSLLKPMSSRQLRGNAPAQREREDPDTRYSAAWRARVRCESGREGGAAGQRGSEAAGGCSLPQQVMHEVAVADDDQHGVLGELSLLLAQPGAHTCAENRVSGGFQPRDFPPSCGEQAALLQVLSPRR